jgi:hypothetical protein
MRQGLKNRIKFDPSNPPRMNNIKIDYLSRNSFNARVKDTYCVSNSACSNNKDASGNWVGMAQIKTHTSRHYYAPFRQPVKGYRKTLNCSSNGIMFESNIRGCTTTTEIYKDKYSDCSGTVCENNGSISTSTIPLTGNDSASRASSGNYTRTAKPIIRSGMQPNIAGKQNSGLKGTKTATRYSYSYRELINNRRKATQIKKLSTQKPTSSTYMSNPQKMPGFGGDCCSEESGGQSTYRYNNNKFATQGSVEASDRITRLKLDTIKGSNRCPPDQSTTYNSSCNGVYSAGHLQSSRTKTWPITTSKYTKVKYASKFNNDHTEVNYPQISALARARGSTRSKRRTDGRILPNNNSVCPGNCPPSLLM